MVLGDLLVHVLLDLPVPPFLLELRLVHVLLEVQSNPANIKSMMITYIICLPSNASRKERDFKAYGEF